jgi:hypothetical protein
VYPLSFPSLEEEAGIFLNMPRIELDFSHISNRKKVRIQEKFPKIIHLISLFLPYIQLTVYTFYKMILLQNENSEISRDDL